MSRIRQMNKVFPIEKAALILLFLFWLRMTLRVDNSSSLVVAVLRVRFRFAITKLESIF